MTYFGLVEVEHQLELLGVAVPGGVDRRVARRDHVAADVVEPVDRLVDRALVAGDRRRREDDRVAAAQLDLRMVVEGHPAQRAERLALGPGRDDHELARRGSRRSRAAGRACPSGTSMWPSDLADVRCSCASSAPPARPCGRAAAAASTTCCTRWMFDAKQVTTIRPSQRANVCSQVRADAGLARARSPGGRRSSSRRRAAAAPRSRAAARRADVGRLAVDRRLVELVVAGDQHGARRRS